MHSMHFIHKLAAFAAIGVAGGLSSGCVAHAHAHGHAAVVYEEPVLVAIEPGIWVVRDYDYAVYYVDGYYWRYDAGVWYQSHVHTGDWVVIHAHAVPRVIVSLDHHAYVHYHGSANAMVKRPPRGRAVGHGGTPPGQAKRRARDARPDPAAGYQERPSNGRPENRGKHKGKKRGN